MSWVTEIKTLGCVLGEAEARGEGVQRYQDIVQMVVHTYNPGTQEQRQEDYEFKAILNYTVKSGQLRLHEIFLYEAMRQRAWK